MLNASLDKRKRKRKKKGKGEDEITALLVLHKEVSSSDKHLESTAGVVKSSVTETETVPKIVDVVEQSTSDVQTAVDTTDVETNKWEGRSSCNG